MKKDYKFIKNKIKIAQMGVVASSFLGLMVLIFGIYIVKSLERQSERIIGVIAIVLLFLLSLFAIYSNISEIKKYKSFL